jgi:hypothetical protein
MIALSAAVSATAQTANTPLPADDDAEPKTGRNCIAIALIRERVSVGRGRNKIELTLFGGACEPPGSGISALSASFATEDSNNDTVLADTCPAYRSQIDKLWSGREHLRRSSNVRPVQAGPFLIADQSDLFELQNENGRRAAARWIRQTLSAIRPCWNNFRSDQTRSVVDRLYGMLR